MVYIALLSPRSKYLFTCSAKYVCACAAPPLFVFNENGLFNDFSSVSSAVTWPGTYLKFEPTTQIRAPDCAARRRLHIELTGLDNGKIWYLWFVYETLTGKEVGALLSLIFVATFFLFLFFSVVCVAYEVTARCILIETIPPFDYSNPFWFMPFERCMVRTPAKRYFFTILNDV